MTEPESHFDIAKAIADKLEGLEKERQQLVLRWVAEGLGLDSVVPPSAERRTGVIGAYAVAPAPGHQETAVPYPQHRSPDIKTFVESKRPKSDVQFAAVIAYYYRFEAGAESRKDSIDAEALQNAARLAARRRLQRPLTTLNNAKKLGLLDSPERGQFCINNVGENLVAMTLPGGAPERTRSKPNSTKPRRAKAKAKAKTKAKKR
jgi:hypothetical protein